MTAIRLIAVGLLVVLAGCSLLAGDAQPPPRADTVTPAPVPSAPTDGDRLPPGVTGAGVVDVDALLAAHVRVATDTPYVWADRQRRVYGSNTTIVSFERRITFVDDRRYRWQLEPRPMFARGEYDRPLVDERFADGDWRYDRRGAPGRGAEYAVEPATGASRRLARVSGQSVGLYLDVPNATVSVVRVDGERYYEVIAREDSYPLAVPLVGDAYNYSVHALVTPAGLVTRLNATYWTAPDGSGTRVHYGYAFRDVGTATLDRPAWVAEASDASTQVRSPNVTDPNISQKTLNIVSRQKLGVSDSRLRHRDLERHDESRRVDRKRNSARKRTFECFWRLFALLDENSA